MNLTLRVAGIAMVVASLAAGPVGAQTMPQQQPPPAAAPARRRPRTIPIILRRTN